MASRKGAASAGTSAPPDGHLQALEAELHDLKRQLAGCAGREQALQRRLAKAEQAAQARSRELAGALEPQHAATEILRAIGRPLGDVQRVLDGIVERAVALCGATDAVPCAPAGRQAAHHAPTRPPGGRWRFPTGSLP